MSWFANGKTSGFLPSQNSQRGHLSPTRRQCFFATSAALLLLMPLALMLCKPQAGYWDCSSCGWFLPRTSPRAPEAIRTWQNLEMFPTFSGQSIWWPKKVMISWQAFGSRVGCCRGRTPRWMRCTVMLQVQWGQIGFCCRADQKAKTCRCKILELEELDGCWTWSFFELYGMA